MDYKKKILESRNQTNVTYKVLFFQNMHKSVKFFDEDSEFLQYIWENINNFKTKKRR